MFLILAGWLQRSTDTVAQLLLDLIWLGTSSFWGFFRNIFIKRKQEVESVNEGKEASQNSGMPNQMIWVMIKSITKNYPDTNNQPAESQSRQ